MIFGEIDSALNLFSRVKSLFIKSAPTATVASRFVQLFEEHGVNRNQIPSFFEHGLTVAIVENDEKLLPALTEEILNAACKLFAVRREWLDGVDTQIHPTHNFYKEPEKFREFVVGLNKKKKGLVSGMLFVADTPSRNYDAVIILEEELGVVGEKVIYRYHICNNWLFYYWKSRVYLTACIALAWKNEVYIHGMKVHFKKIDEYLEGEKYLSDFYNSLVCRSNKWHPEDMACDPKNLFEGLTEHLHDGEYQATIELWLELADKGLMDTCFNPAPKEIFQQALLNKPK
jgi:hypothetical protein